MEHPLNRGFNSATESSGLFLESLTAAMSTKWHQSDCPNWIPSGAGFHPHAMRSSAKLREGIFRHMCPVGAGGNRKEQNMRAVLYDGCLGAHVFSSEKPAVLPQTSAINEESTPATDRTGPMLRLNRWAFLQHQSCQNSDPN